MRRPEAAGTSLSAAGLAVLAVAYLVANRAYPLDTLATPGPGIFPLAAGILLLGLAACQAVAAARAGPAAAAAPADGRRARPGGSP